MRFLTPILFVVFSIYSISIQAQDLAYESYDWIKDPKLHKLETQNEKEDEVIVTQNHLIEFVINNEGNLDQYDLRHMIIRVNSNNAIESNNKIYLPVSNPQNVITQKARVIKPNGQVQELNEKNIQEATDEETKHTYRYFAVEGVEVGCEIEYILNVRKDPSTAMTGKTLYLQDETPRQNVSVKIISPKFLQFETKSLNGLAEMQKDTTAEDKHILYFENESIDKIKKEAFSVTLPNTKQLQIKLQYNTNRGRQKLYTYTKVSDIIYRNIYTPAEKSIFKKIKKILKKEPSLKFSNDVTEAQKIRSIEDFVKGNFQAVNAYDPRLEDMNFILENKVGSNGAITRLFAILFDYYKIKNELVVTCDRTKNKFDKNFQLYSFLDEYLFYFSSIDQYMSPTTVVSRLGFVPHEFTHTDALFIEPVEVAGVKTGLATVRFVEPLPAEVTTDLLDLDIKFEEDNIQNLQIGFKRDISGYYAQYYQPTYDFIEESQYELLNENLVKYIGEDLNPKDIKIENKGVKNFGIKPLLVSANLESEDYVEKAGKKYLFKLGELIGPQAEMYQDEKRIFPVENDFNRKYVRRLRFTVPDGYQVKNLDALNIDIFHENDKKVRTATFTSTYKQEGNVVSIEVVEYYEEICYDLKDFEPFRKVVNAAADFNKIVLFVEPK